MKRLSWDLTLYSVSLVVLFILILPLTLWLPAELAAENGPIEWLQVMVLAIGCIAAIGGFLYGCGRFATRSLFLCSTPVWLILIGRELSWGRVFFPNGNGGYLSLKALWYGAYVYPTIAIAVIVTFVYMIKNGLHTELLFFLEESRWPAIDCLVLLVTVAMAHIGEHYAGAWMGAQHILLEELAETVMYYSLVTITINLGFYAEFQPRVKRLLYR
jgi:hypothetical protein